MTRPAEYRRRREDSPLITGQGCYVDDVRVPEGRPAACHMAVVRSPYAHAIIDRIDLDAARALPGVAAALSGAELVAGMPALRAIPVPGLKQPERCPMATDRVRYVGDPIAVVLAEDPYTAIDARYLVEVDYTPLPVVSDPEAALAPDAPVLYDELGTNVAFSLQSQWGDIDRVFEQAEHTVRLRLVNQRLAPSSLEPRACLFDYDMASGILSAWVSAQSVYRTRDSLSHMLGLPLQRIRVRNADVGGGFGSKAFFVGEELIAALLAMKLGRPVKWIEARSENLQAQMHGRGQINDVEAAYQSDGTLLGFKIRSLGDLGAFLNGTTAVIPTRTPMMVCGPYRVQAVESLVTGVFTNKVPTAPYRGAGRPEATYIAERTMDRIAHDLQLDPAEVRRRNFIPPDVFPYETVTGMLYDSGNYLAGLDQALELADYQGWRERQRERRAAHAPKLLGIGLATFTELAGEYVTLSPIRDSATVRIRRDGTIEVSSAVAHNGQGHVTLFTQIAAGVFGIPGEHVEVRLNDASLPSFSVGTLGSRTTQIAGSAIYLAAHAAREKALQVAAHALEVSPTDLVLEQGRVLVRGVTSRSISLGELAQRVEEHPELIEHDPPNPANGVPIEGLAAWRDFAPSHLGWSSGAHVAVIEIDAETGDIHMLSYIAVDDCGHVLNHTLTEGQIHGSLAQGIGQALFEEVVYDQEGQLLSSTFMDYAMPLAAELPHFTIGLVETPSPFNPLGAKGLAKRAALAARLPL